MTTRASRAAPNTSRMTHRPSVEIISLTQWDPCDSAIVCFPCKTGISIARSRLALLCSTRDYLLNRVIARIVR
jgi:hypothetical protein